MRGAFISICVDHNVDEIERAVRAVVADAKNQALRFAVIVQPLLVADVQGHLSNEYRHAQRVVDFKYEAESTHELIGVEKGETGSFRLERPVGPANTRATLRLREGHASADFLQKLKEVGVWLASGRHRGHVEWVVSEGRLWVVQADKEHPTKDIAPAIEWRGLPSPRGRETKVQALRLVTGSAADRRWRKTKSHETFIKAQEFVPPIWILDDERTLKQLVRGEISLSLKRDLSKLLPAGLILRVDVDAAEWPNLPFRGPVRDSAAVIDFIKEAVKQAKVRSITLNKVAIVIHQAISAQAGAWSTQVVGTSVVRIDAVWGLPDGLQSLVHDSYIVDVDARTVEEHTRYKDSFVDSHVPSGESFIQRANHKRARAPCLTSEQALAIADGTARVVAYRQKSMKIMWFCGVSVPGSRDGVMPWIYDDADEVSIEAPAAREEQALRRRIGLGNFKAISDPSDLDELSAHPERFDVGNHHALFRPSAKALRDRSFIKAVAAKLMPMQWKLVLQGSLLAHAPYQFRKMGLTVVPISELLPPRKVHRFRKLVRDKIPAKIRSHGESAFVTRLDAESFDSAIRLKAVEESLELVAAKSKAELLDEAADVLAVLLDLAKFHGTKWEVVEKLERKKRRLRGGFGGRNFLIGTVPTYLAARYRSKLRGEGTAAATKLSTRVGFRAPLVPPVAKSRRTELTFRWADGLLRVNVLYGDKQLEVEFVDPATQRISVIKQLTLWGEQDE